MPVAAWQWLVAGTVAVAAHGAIGLALLSPPAGGGGSAGKSVSVGLVLEAGDTAVEATRAQPVTAAEAAAEPAKVAAPRPLQSHRFEVQRAPRPARILPSQQPSPSDLAAAAATRSEAAAAVAKERAAPSTAPELPPLPSPRPEAAPDSGAPEDGTQTADAAGGAAAQAQAEAEASAPGFGDIGRAEAAHEARAAYVAQLQAWLQRHKRYPQRAIARRQQGTATLYFVVDRTGRLLDYRLEQSSGHRLLDREALEMIERAAPLPRMPAGLSGSDLAVVLPVRFALR